MGTKKTLYFVAMLAILGLPFIISQPVFAASGDISQVETFIRNIIKVIAGLAGLVATGFFVVGVLPTSQARAIPNILIEPNERCYGQQSD